MDYPTVEHAYQAAKTNSSVEREMIKNIVKPGDAKKAGRTVVMRRDWNKSKYSVMHNLVYQKFNRYPVLRQNLLETGDQQLIEGNTWHDNYWGACSCARCKQKVKQNKLGEILTNVRYLLLITSLT